MNKLRLIVLILSSLGIVLSVYLTYTHVTMDDTSFCLTGSGCDIIKSSTFSRIYGVPVPVFGLIGYLTLWLLTYLRFDKSRIKLIYFISVVGLSFSIYLSYIEFFVLKALCSFCIVSGIVMLSIFISILTTGEIKLGNFKNSLASILILIIVFGASYISHSDALSVKPAPQNVIALAQHLTKTGAHMYGSDTCPHCQVQKMLFGSAFEDIDYVECHPDAEKSRSTLCLEKGIEAYPTWEINGQFYEGTKSLKELAKLSGFKP